MNEFHETMVLYASLLSKIEDIWLISSDGIPEFNNMKYMKEKPSDCETNNTNVIYLTEKW